MAAIWLLGACAAGTTRGQDSGMHPGGDLSIHDPSTIVKCKGRYWVFGTGWGVRAKSSLDLAAWKEGPRVFEKAPFWTTNTVPGNRGYFWAPDVVESCGRYLLYYSVSTWGSQNSAIGLAANVTLDDTDRRYRWSDEGLVIHSCPTNDFNAIDPGVFLDSEKRLWMAFGSYWSGIKLVQLDPRTGKRADTNSPAVALAWHSSIEAPALCQRGNDYFLFVNWGQCCRGTNSTYNIRVGRSKHVRGPYADKGGVSLMQDGGTLLLETNGRFIGPGHAGVYTEAGRNMFSFHYYDRDQKGTPKLAIRRLQWGSDGWPVVDSTE
ncbi:MAG TPA: arabinan endo-1,5-alpha-L-arabinosidase [Verrucomicrobiae bacterium]